MNPIRRAIPGFLALLLCAAAASASAQTLDVARTFAAIVLLSAIGIAFFYAIEYLERRALFWNQLPV